MKKVVSGVGLLIFGAMFFITSLVMIHLSSWSGGYNYEIERLFLELNEAKATFAFLFGIFAIIAGLVLIWFGLFKDDDWGKKA